MGHRARYPIYACLLGDCISSFEILKRILTGARADARASCFLRGELTEYWLGCDHAEL